MDRDPVVTLPVCTFKVQPQVHGIAAAAVAGEPVVIPPVPGGQIPAHCLENGVTLPAAQFVALATSVNVQAAAAHRPEIVIQMEAPGFYSIAVHELVQQIIIGLWLGQSVPGNEQGVPAVYPGAAFQSIGEIRPVYAVLGVSSSDQVEDLRASISRT